jgi:hypothetical protein
LWPERGCRSQPWAARAPGLIFSRQGAGSDVEKDEEEGT